MTIELLPLRLFMLGPPVVRLGEEQLTFPTRKTQALLIYLAIEPGLHPREQLAALLWPEASPKRSYANLRNTLGRLQTALRPANGQSQTHFLSITHTALGLNPVASIVIDLHTVEKAYALARAHRSNRTLLDESAGLPLLHLATDYWREDFLTGFSLEDAPGFDEWAAVQREVWRRRQGLILDRLSEIQYSSGEFAGATETTSRWIAIDPLNEVAYRRKMRAQFAAGERGQALESYEACRAKLADELGVEPEPDTISLVERIRTQAPSVHPPIHRTKTQSPRLVTSVAFLGGLFAGRTSEFQTLVRCFKLAATGQPQVVLLRGEAGIGKTRLARKFLAWARAQGAGLLQGSGFESGSHLPFQPLLEALRLWLKDENAPKDLLDHEWLSPLSQLLPELRKPDLGLTSIRKEGGARKEDTDLEMEVNRTQLFELFTKFTRTLAQEVPLVLFVDDLQWTDRATLDLLQFALRRWKDRAAQVLLLVSLRSEALHPMTQSRQVGGSTGGPPGLFEWLTRVERELTPVHIELEPLGESETMEMVRSILSPPAADFAQWLYAETLGQPFYLMETLKDLLERRVLHAKQQAEGQWVYAVDDEHDLGKAVRVPSTIHIVIRSRLNRLSPNAFSLLAGGAVLEQEITFERLCAIANLSADLALSALDELISSRLLLDEPRPGAASAYIFINDMVRDVVYTEAGDARRRIFHRRAREILEAAGDSAAVLAHHALAAGLALAGFRHSLAAGRDALRISAVSEAIAHFEHAHKILREALPLESPGREEGRELYEQLSKAYKLGGQTERASAIEAERERFFSE